MAVKIKLKRLGKIHAPYYRLVVADARAKRDGRAIEEVGKYHPMQEPSLIEVDSERVQYWLSVGAQPTDPVRHILQITGDWQRFRGEEGAEGTLKSASPRPDKKAAFDAALKETYGETETAATTPRGRGRRQEARTQKADTAETASQKAGDRKADGEEPASGEPGGSSRKRAAKPGKPGEQGEPAAAAQKKDARPERGRAAQSGKPDSGKAASAKAASGKAASAKAASAKAASGKATAAAASGDAGASAHGNGA